MSKDLKLERIKKTGVIAIMRAKSSSQLIEAAEAIKAGGIDVIEVTMTTPNALNVISEATVKFGNDVLFGAGSVLDPETARAAILAGAEFVVGPSLDIDLISLCNRYSIPVIPGCFSPTELVTAWQAGASMVKLFPASLGGPSFMKDLLAPLPQLEIIPVGGVNLENAKDYINNGAAALGVGSSLINQKLLDGNDMDELTRRARAFREAVKLGREQ
jgi:2-dehydro-3-deoxyphosphogluconate aldolase/(4S)-4-hydroxy-2-oxoglutarate aldolase